jgi:glycosyltransferase involved in cell wall biosynthesis
LNKSINIFHLSPFPYYSGGIDTWLNNLLGSIPKSVNITLYCPTPTDEQICVGKIFNDEPFTNLSIVYVGNFKGYFSMGKWGVTAFFKLMKKVDKHSVNLVLSTIPTMFPVYLLKKFGFLKGDVILSVRGNLAQDVIDLKKSIIFQWLVKIVERNLITAVDKVISNGHDTQKYLTDFYNIDSLVIPNGFTSNNRRSENDKDIELLQSYKNNGFKLVVHVGTVRKIKGIDYLIEAFCSKTLRNESNIKLVFVGKGLIDEYSNYCKRENIDAVFLGQKNNVDDYYELADLIINISGGSGVSNSLLEAMCLGKNVIAWDKLTFSQVITDGVNGHLVEYMNTEALAHKIHQSLMPANKLDDAIIKLAVDKFSWDRVYLEWENVFENIRKK